MKCKSTSITVRTYNEILGLAFGLSSKSMQKLFFIAIYKKIEKKTNQSCIITII